MNNLNPLSVILVAVLTLIGALIDNFSWGVTLALAGCVFMLATGIRTAVAWSKALQEQEAEEAALATAEEKLGQRAGQG